MSRVRPNKSDEDLRFLTQFSSGVGSSSNQCTNVCPQWVALSLVSIQTGMWHVPLSLLVIVRARPAVQDVHLLFTIKTINIWYHLITFQHVYMCVRLCTVGPSIQTKTNELHSSLILGFLNMVDPTILVGMVFGWLGVPHFRKPRAAWWGYDSHHLVQPDPLEAAVLDDVWRPRQAAAGGWPSASSVTINGGKCIIYGHIYSLCVCV